VAAQGLTTPMIEPGILAYSRLLSLSIPLGVVALIILVMTKPHPGVLKAQGSDSEIPKEVNTVLKLAKNAYL